MLKSADLSRGDLQRPEELLPYELYHQFVNHHTIGMHTGFWVARGGWFVMAQFFHTFSLSL